MRLKRSFFPWIFFHFFEFIHYYIAALLSLYILHSSQVKIPKLAKELADKILIKDFQQDYIFTFVSLAFLILIFRTLSRWLFFYPARIQQKNLRIEVLEMIRDAYPSQYQNYSFGQLYQILLNDINRLRGFIGFALLQVGNIIIATWVLIPKLQEIDSKIMITFTPMVTSVVIFSIIIFLFQPFLKRATKVQGDVQNVIIETFDAKGSIANYQREDAFLNQFIDKSNDELDNFFKASIGPAFSSPLVPLGMSISLLWGAYLIHELNLGVTTIILYSGFLFLALEPLMFLSWMGIVTASGLTGWQRLKKLVNDLNQNPDILGSLEINELLNFNIFLRDKKNLISLEKNKIKGMCSPTGEGKSFLLYQMADLCHQKKLNYSLVLQEPHLFNDTLLNNLKLGREFEDMDKVHTLLSIFELDQLEQREESILDLIVGENGKKLSGGQIKRIALIQSLLSDSDVLLWDDPFSSVDNILEKQILEKLIKGQYFKDKYVLFTSHRVTTFKFIEEIYYLKKNQILNYQDIHEGELNEFFQSQIL